MKDKTGNQYWNGVWISQGWERDILPIGGYPVAFRKDYAFDNKPERAVIKVSAANRYVLYINGEWVSHGPARSFARNQMYDEIEITGFLAAGSNSFAALLIPYTPAIGCNPASKLGFILDGFAAYGGMEYELFTDSSWMARAANWYLPFNNMLSITAGFQEHFNATLEPVNWRTDAPGEADAWKPAWYVGPVGTPPWKAMCKRSVRFPVESMYDTALIWKGNSGRDILPENKNFAAIFNTDEIHGDYMQPATVDFLDNSKSNVYVFDFHKTRFVRPGIEIIEAFGELRVELYYSLELTDRPSAMVGFGGNTEGFVDTIVPREGNTSWEATYTRGFRFVTVKIAGSGSCRFKLAAKCCEYPYMQDTSFETSDNLLAAIWKISGETIRSSSNDVIVDTCSREDNLWTLDACVTAKAAFYTFGELDMWRRCLILIAQGIDEDGIPKSIVPSEYSYMCLFDQAFGWVCSCMEYYMMSGDVQFLEETAGPIERFIRQCEKYMTREDLFCPPDYSWYWVDWAPIDKTPYSLPINCLFLLAVDIAASIAEEIQSEILYDLAHNLTIRLRSAINRFYDDEMKCYKARIKPEMPLPSGNPMNNYMTGKEIPAHNIHGNALACLSKCGSARERHGAASFVADAIKTSGPAGKFGPGWTEFILSPLFEHGYGVEALACIKKNYGAFIDAQAPTWGEAFNGKEFNTAHGWGSSVNTLIIERVLGVRPLEPGWRKILIDPHPGDIQSIFYKLSIRGNLYIFILNNDSITVRVPEGVTILYKGEQFLGGGDICLNL